MRWSTSFVVVLAAAALGVAAPARATTFRAGRDIVIGPSETIRDDLMAAGGNVTIQGTVTGDVMVAASALHVTGRVGGDLVAMAQTVDVPGRVGGGLRVAAQSADLSGEVGRSLDAAGQSVLVAPSARIGQDVDAAAGHLTLDGTVGRDVRAAADRATVGARIAHGVRYQGRALTVAPTARIGGAVVSRSAQAPQIAAGAVVAGPVTHLPPPAPRRHQRSALAGVGSAFLWALSLFIVGAVGLAVVPRFVRAAADALSGRPGWSALWGVVFLVVAPVAALLIVFSLVGAPLSLLLLAVWGFAALFAAVPVALWIGRQVGAWARRGTPVSPYAALAIGMAVLFILWCIPVLGWIVTVAVVLFGVGTFVLSAAGRSGPVQPLPAA